MHGIHASPGFVHEVQVRTRHAEEEALFWRGILESLSAEVTGGPVALQLEPAAGRGRTRFQSTVLSIVRFRSNVQMTTTANDVLAHWTPLGSQRPNIHAVTAALSRLKAKRAIRRLARGVYEDARATRDATPRAQPTGS